ncbi:MAG: nucleotidyltransferase family protein [Chitinophagaceae bacterium]|nr:nucleotidyltransferase family protein [Chitinophagaceae bacterium]
MNVCLLLAAGSSSRMGQPKMLLDFRGKTILQHSIDEIKKLPGNQLLVVTGCYYSLLKEILEQQQIEFVQNEQWQEGMGTSIQKGVKYITRYYPDATSVTILVCDQPFISAGLFQEMREMKQQAGKGIIACTYNDTIGTPVLFDKTYFDQLALLSGPSGAKKIVQQFAEDTAMVNFPLGAVDIDTAEDYEQLIGIK